MYGVYAIAALVGASSIWARGEGEGPLLTSSFAIVRVLRGESGKTVCWGFADVEKRLLVGLSSKEMEKRKDTLSYSFTCMSSDFYEIVKNKNEDSNVKIKFSMSLLFNL